MQIDKDSVVAMNYVLKNDQGEILDQSEGEALTYIHGHGSIVPGLEQAMQGRKAGDSFDIVVSAEDGYGVRRPDAIVEIPRGQLPGGVEPEVGMQLMAGTPDGGAMPLTLIAIGEEFVTADANHPLAGQALHFSIAIDSVREASAEELSHGHVHGPGGHHH